MTETAAPQPAGTLVDGVDIDAVHAAVAGCPGVSSVGSGTVAALTTYLPGRRISGIRVSPEAVELEIVAAWGPSAAELNTRIRAALSAVVIDRPIEITIVDIDLPDVDLPANSVSPAAAIRPESESS